MDAQAQAQAQALLAAQQQPQVIVPPLADLAQGYLNGQTPPALAANPPPVQQSPASPATNVNVTQNNGAAGGAPATSAFAGTQANAVDPYAGMPPEVARQMLAQKLLGKNDSAITNLPELQNARADLQDKGLAANARDAADAKVNARQAGALDKEQAEQEAPVHEQLLNYQQQATANLQAAHAAIMQQADERMAHFQQVQDEMQKMAVEQPTDLFGQAGVNGVLGRIALFLGGAGVNGNHANHAMEQLTTMANANVASQKRRFEMLSEVGQGDKTAYGMLMNKLQNTDAADAVMHNAYLSLAQSNLKAIGARYAPQKAQLTMNQTLAAIDAKKRQNDLVVQGSYQNAAAGDLALVNSAAVEDAKAMKAQLDDLHNNSIEGYIGTVPQTEHAKIAEINAGARNMIDFLGEMDTMLKGKPSIENLRAFAAARAQVFAAARNYYQTGTRLEEGEVKLINTTAISESEALFKQLQNATSASDVSALRTKIEDTRALIARGAYRATKTHAPNVEFDSKDKVWGQYNPETYVPRWQREKESKDKHDKGQEILKDAPQWAGY